MIVTDIETLGLSNCADYFTPDMLEAKVPGNMTRQDTIEQFLKDEPHRIRKRLLDRASLDPDLGRIGVLGWWDNTADCVHTMHCRNESEEREALERWCEEVETHGQTYGHMNLIGGKSILQFDLPFLKRRAIHLGLGKAFPRMERQKYRHASVLDVEEVLSEGRIDRVRPMDFYIRRFGVIVPHGAEISGKDMPALMAAGEYEAAAMHCYDDLAVTVQLLIAVGEQDEKDWPLLKKVLAKEAPVINAVAPSLF